MSVSGPSESDKKKSVDRLAAFGARVMSEDEANEYINRVAERLEKNIDATQGIDQLADNYFRQVIEQIDKFRGLAVSIQGVKSLWGDRVVFPRLGTGDTDGWRINKDLFATCQCPPFPISEKRCDSPKVI